MPISGFDHFVFLALPHFTRMPSDQTAWEGEAVSFPCEAEGSPKPLIFWTMEGSQVLPTLHINVLKNIVFRVSCDFSKSIIFYRN